MTDLNTLLDQNHAPDMRRDLAARILAASESAEPANDALNRRPWWAMGGIAAMAVMAALFFIQPTSTSDADWTQIADASGFSELYDWVEGEDG